MKRQHVKQFQAIQYEKADQRIQKCVIMAMIAFCGGFNKGVKRFNRYQLI